MLGTGLRLALFFFFGLLCVRAETKPCTSHDAERRTLLVDGYQREYWLYVPCSVRPHADLVIMLHGWGRSGEEVARHYGWATQAEKYGFVVAFPSGLPVRADLPVDLPLPAGSFAHSTWHAPNSRGWWTAEQLKAEGDAHHPDDNRFISQLHAELNRQGITRTSRIFIAGFSNGAFMAKHFSISHPNEVKGVVAAGYAGDVFPTRLEHPIPILQLLGTADNIGAMTAARWQQMRPLEREYWWGGGLAVPTVQGDAARWASLDQCHPVATTTQEKWGQALTWSGCAHHVSVQLYLIDQLGHEWVGSSESNWKQSHPYGAALDFAAIAANFFEQQQR